MTTRRRTTYVPTTTTTPTPTLTLPVTTTNAAVDAERAAGNLLVLIREISVKVDALDRLIGTRLDSLTDSLIAHEKLNEATFASSEKAISKAENSQSELNVKNNEFRTQLDDQAKMFMPRTESLSMFKSFEEKLVSLKSELTNAIRAVETAAQRDFDSHTRILESLGLSRSAGEGKTAGATAMWGYVLGVIGLIAMLVTLAVGVITLV